MTIPERLSALRQRMAENGIDLYYIPSDDFHSSEYVGDYFKCREWISGFTGSAGTVVVTADSAGLWTDGRYFLQAADQLKDSGIDLYRMGEPGVPPIINYLVDFLRGGKCLGLDGRTTSAAWLNAVKFRLRGTKASFRTDVDLVGEIWNDRPRRSAERIWPLDEAYAGKSRADKLAELRGQMRAAGAEWLVLSSLDDIAWLLNLRGSDVEFNPVFLSYMMISQKEARLFVQHDAGILDLSTSRALVDDGLHCFPYDSIALHLSRLKDTAVMMDLRRTSCALQEVLDRSVRVINRVSPTTPAKAKKNPVEAENIREAHRKDGTAIVRFLRWLKQSIGSVPMTEISAAEKLEEYRAEQEHYIEPSFGPISAFGPHSAVVHYSADETTNAELRPEGFLLMDTGGQYLEGTTDITRTIALGPLTQEMKQHYTAVLRGNLNLAAAVFRAGSTGVNLDILARAPLWEKGLDFNHGTGHGVGYLLCCHEGPQNIRPRISPVIADNAPLKPGMVTSDEPGVYLAGKYGIRLENLVLCREHSQTEFGTFLCFDVLTLVPWDREAILPEEMTARELALLNAYHERVYTELAPRLNEEDRAWLREATLPL